MTREDQPNRFASAVEPVVAETRVSTDATGLGAGDIAIPTQSGTIRGYRAHPRGAGPFAIVLVVHEIFGLHEHIEDVTRRLAKSGYLAVAPELFQRQGGVAKLTTIEAVRALVASVPDGQVMTDLDASLAWAARNGGDPQRTAVTGFCWGGRVTWLYAAHQPLIKAAVAWYGRLVGDATPLTPRFPIDVMSELKAPVLGLYGGLDEGIPLATVEQASAALARAGGTSHIHVYPEAGHAFYADYRPSYRHAAAIDGWQRQLQRNGV